MTTPQSAYEEVLTKVRQAKLLGSSASILSWDQETMMPRAAVAHRAKQLAQLATLCHEMAVEPRIGELLEISAEDAELTGEPHSVTAVNLREIKRDYEKETRLPASLVAEIAETTSLAQNEWAQARKSSDFARFRPWLEKVIALMRRKAECLGIPEGGEVWDALADDYEPGMIAKDLEPLFASLRERLSALMRELTENGTAPATKFLELALLVPQQEAFVRFIAEQIGFDFERGRMDVSTHPFTGGSHCDDVRITTRFREDNMLDALGSTMHEAGHGMYEQSLPAAHIGEPMGMPVSLGVHESQSRLWENQVGRSRAFWKWCHPRLEDYFGKTVEPFELEDVYGAANLVKPDFIRVEADEATYNLHILVRFELELALMRGDLEAGDVPSAWNGKYKEFLGIDVPDDRRGCMQDIHWSVGSFGYFPTYTLGNLYAAQFFAKAKEEIPDLEEQFGRGEFGALKAWLAEKIHSQGQRYRAPELCEVVTGKPPSVEPLMEHLAGKLRPLYGLA